MNVNIHGTLNKIGIQPKAKIILKNLKNDYGLSKLIESFINTSFNEEYFSLKQLEDAINVNKYFMKRIN